MGRIEWSVTVFNDVLVTKMSVGQHIYISHLIADLPYLRGDCLDFVQHSRAFAAGQWLLVYQVVI